MTGKQPENEQEEVRDLDVPAREAEGVKGGVIVPDHELSLFKPERPKGFVYEEIE